MPQQTTTVCLTDWSAPVTLGQAQHVCAPSQGADNCTVSACVAGWRY
jgi:hypothetical protein